jgi:rSAM/selenodomain-associated transferase 1
MQPELSTEQSSQLQDALLQDTLQMTEQLSYPLYISFASVEGRGYFQGNTNASEIFPQVSGNLGVKLFYAVSYVLEKGIDKLIVIGTDSPELMPSHIQQAIKELDGVDVVIGPTEDGGYNLIGMKRFLPALFARIDWGTEKVFSQTCSIMQENQYSFSCLPIGHDVDYWKDLRRIYHKLQETAWEKRPLHTENFINQIMNEKQRR